MTAILTHQACTGPYITSPRPPAHLADCVEQYCLFNSGPLYILTDRENLPYLPTGDNIHAFAIEDYHSPKVARFESLYNYKPNEFWCVTFTRLIYIENFLREHGLSHVCEFANDVLVYFNIDDYAQTLKRLYTGLALTPCGPQHVLDGFAYIGDWQALADLTGFFIKMLATLGIDGIIGKYKYDMVNEMTMMHRYSEDVGVNFLPIMPWGPYSQGVDEFGAVFDPATWGQYVGGTRTDGPGAKPQNHHIGVMLGENPKYNVVWRFKDGLRVPYFIHDGELTRINNLHIHSKNMRGFMSRWTANPFVTQIGMKMVKHSFDYQG